MNVKPRSPKLVNLLECPDILSLRRKCPEIIKPLYNKISFSSKYIYIYINILLTRPRQASREDLKMQSAQQQDLTHFLFSLLKLSKTPLLSVYKLYKHWPLLPFLFIYWLLFFAFSFLLWHLVFCSWCQIGTWVALEFRIKSHWFVKLKDGELSGERRMKFWPFWCRLLP